MSGLLVACLIVGCAWARGVPSSRTSDSYSSTSSRGFRDGTATEKQARLQPHPPGRSAAEGKVGAIAIWCRDSNPDTTAIYMCLRG